MGCNCGKKKVVVTPPIVELPKEEIDWYNNIDEIRPYTQEDYLNDELRKWNGGDKVGTKTKTNTEV